MDKKNLESFNQFLIILHFKSIFNYGVVLLLKKDDKVQQHRSTVKKQNKKFQGCSAGGFKSQKNGK